MILTHNRFALGSLAALVFSLVVCASSAQAGMLTPGIYEIFNHPDGNLTSQSPYGIRVDSAPPDGPGPTFDVADDDDAGPVLLTWDGGTTATIVGTTVNNLTDETWDVSYTLTGVSAVANGIVATAASGSLTYSDVGPPPAVSVISLTGKQAGGHVFRFLMDGHRLDNDDSTIVGRGWFMAGGTNDWLVTGVQLVEFEIPEPMTAALLLPAALAATLRRRR